MAMAFADQGWRVSALIEGQQQATATPEQDNITLYHSGHRLHRGDTPSIKSYAVSLLALWQRALSLPRHDLVITLTDPPMLGWIGPILAAKWGSRSLHWCQDVYPDLFRLMPNLLTRLLVKMMQPLARCFMQAHDAVIAIDEDMAEHLTTHFGIRRSRLDIISNATADFVGPAAKKAASQWRERHDLNDKFVVLYAGNLGLCHPVEDVLDAAEALQAQTTKIELVFAGLGRRKQELMAAVNHRNIKNIRLLPYQDEADVAAMLSAADMHLVLMSERSKGLLFPQKTLSAMAVGRPVLFVGPETHWTSRNLTEAGAGQRVAPGHPLHLVHAMTHFAHNHDALKAASAAAAQIGLAMSSTRQQAHMLEIADNLLSRKTPVSAPSLPVEVES